MNDAKHESIEAETPVRNPAEIEVDVPGLREAVDRKLQLWKERLIDLSLRNRLLNFRETRSSTLSVIDPDPSAIFDRLVRDQGDYFIYVVEDTDLVQDYKEDQHNPREGESADRTRRPDELVYQGNAQRTARVLYTLRSRAHTELEERGTNVLFVALGFLRWTETGTSSVQYTSPLVLIPVQLERERSRQRYRLTRVPEDVVMNPALAVKLRNDFGITLPELPEDPEDTDLNAFLAQVTEAVTQLPTWGVRQECEIGLFSFLKFMMYKDLEASKDLAARHRLVGALAGFPTLLPDLPPDLVTAERLDEAIPPERAFQILDADSSQQEAIVAALSGVSFVLQGPPGTGKSQTIANIIAECLVAGKRIFFVSEKMAALEVVKRRLDQCGIGEFCLELHSHKTNKRAVLEDLEHALTASQSAQMQTEQFPFHQLEERRSQLNAFVKALHTPRSGLNLTPFQVHTRLAHLWAAPDISASVHEPLNITTHDLNQIRQRLDQLVANGTVLREYDDHPWKDTLLTTHSLQQQAQIEGALRSLIENLGRAATLMPRLSSLAHAGVGQMENVLFDAYTPGLLELGLDDLYRRFNGPYSGFGKYLRYPGYRMSIRSIRRHARRTRESVVGDLSLAILVRDGRRLFPANAGEAEREATRDGSTLRSLVRLVAWAQDYISFVTDSGDSPHTAIIAVVREGQEVLRALHSGRSFLETLFPSNQVGFGEDKPFTDVRGCLEVRLAKLSELGSWIDIQNAISELRRLGLGGFIEEVLRQKLNPRDIPAAYEKQLYLAWIDEVNRDDPTLNSFRSPLHEQAIEEFRHLDKRLVQDTHRRIAAHLNSHRPSLGFAGQRGPDTGILQREIQKRRRHKPLRRLFAEIPALIQGLKPCFLMSPMSVASYLVPDKMRFDILLFDEASQIMPEDAIGSILRTPQVIVVGDTKQLPPTRFFATVEGDDWEDEELQDDAPLDSIMEEALAAGLREKSLLWHYRSRDESLIAFSNREFYRNSLITFPSAGTQSRPMGIQFVYLPDGVYDRSRSRTNRREAHRVAELVYQHYEQSPERSLGVVAFSLPQADAIDAAVEALRQKDPKFDEWCNAEAPERFFIKNLENVQGDERDVMLFSVGYGPDERGQITMNFGPLNQDGGPRRLNVAVTRAKEHVKLVSSLDPSQIDLTKTRAEGVRLLKQYMELAKRGVDALRETVRLSEDKESGSPFEQEVYEALIAEGIRLQKQVGVSGYRIDLGVVDPHRPGCFLLGIECDGATYHSFKTARDRDRLRQQVLEDLGWAIHRIWSRDWVENRQREIEKVLAALRQAGSGSPR